MTARPVSAAVQLPVETPLKPAKDYVVTMQGNRDSYQVPLALLEAGALRTFVTDFYAPPVLLKRLGRFYPELHRRQHPDLPATRTCSAVTAFAYDAVTRAFKIRGDRHWRRIDRLISRRSRRLAARHPDAGLLSYHNYSLDSFPYVLNKPKILFQYHPHPIYLEKLFAEDYARFPEVQWSFENERDARPAATHTAANLDEWTHADALICASGVTRRSLEHVGCAKPIHVVPYGVTPGFRIADPVAAKRHDGCRFLFVGQGVQRKGLHHLLRAWRLAKLEHSRLDLVVGRMDPGIEALLPLANVHHSQRLTKDALTTRFAEADVFVMPSLVEGFGLVYLEALAMGCFCLGTRNTGLPDLQLGDDMVAYADVGDVEALAEQLRALERRHAEGGLDPAAIAEAGSAFTFARFRQGVRQAVADIEAATK